MNHPRFVKLLHQEILHRAAPGPFIENHPDGSMPGTGTAERKANENLPRASPREVFIDLNHRRVVRRPGQSDESDRST